MAKPRPNLKKREGPDYHWQILFTCLLWSISSSINRDHTFSIL